MKRVLLLIVLQIIAITSFAQSSTVTLVVSGEGATKQDATAMALRAAIEQAFGAFVTSNTAMLNDEIVRDEIATVSSGNIESYTEVSAYQIKELWEITVKAKVCINKLVNYVKAHGAQVEFDGQSFAMQMKMDKLNKENEIVALEAFLEKVHMFCSEYNLADYSLNVDKPSQNRQSGNYNVYCKIITTPNSNFKTLQNFAKSTFESLYVPYDVYSREDKNGNAVFLCDEPFPGLEAKYRYNKMKYSLRNDVWDNVKQRINMELSSNINRFRVDRIEVNGHIHSRYSRSLKSEQQREYWRFELTEDEIYNTREFRVVPDLEADKILACDAVDLGLSVKWSNINFRTTKAQPYGLYTSHSSFSGYGTGEHFSIMNWDLTRDTICCDNGYNWRMPTEAEWKELIDENNCSWVWTDNYDGSGSAGYIVTSKKVGYTDKYIFLPSAGYSDEDEYRYRTVVGDYNIKPDGGYYWSSEWHMEFNSDNLPKISSSSRRNCSIRLVTDRDSQ